jgi:allantoin racemase
MAKRGVVGSLCPGVAQAIVAATSAYARPDTEIVACQPDWGPVALDGCSDGVPAAAAVVEKLTSSSAPSADAVVLAGFGDPAAQALRELLGVPVFDITECGAHMACLDGRRFGVLTTLDRNAPPIDDLLRVVGLWERCSGVRSIELETDALAGDVSYCPR